MNNDKILTDIAGIFGMTALIVIRIESVNFNVRIVLAMICLVGCLFYTVKASRSEKTTDLKTEGYLKKLHSFLFLSYGLIAVLMLI